MAGSPAGLHPRCVAGNVRCCLTGVWLMELLAAHFDPLARVMPPFGAAAVVNAIVFYVLFYRIRAAAARRGTAWCVVLVAAAFPVLAGSGLDWLNDRQLSHPGVTENLLRLVVTSLPSSLLLALVLAHDTRSWVVGLVPLAAVAVSCFMVGATIRWEFAFATWQLVCVCGLMRFAQPAWAIRARSDSAEEARGPLSSGRPYPADGAGRAPAGHNF